MEFLLKQNIESVKHIKRDELTNTYLSEILVDWRTNYMYEIDGIIVTNDKAKF